MATAPVPRLDGAAIQIKNLLYVFAGYGTIDYVRISACSNISYCCSSCFAFQILLNGTSFSFYHTLKYSSFVHYLMAYISDYPS